MIYFKLPCFFSDPTTLKTKKFNFPPDLTYLSNKSLHLRGFNQQMVRNIAFNWSIIEIHVEDISVRRLIVVTLNKIHITAEESSKMMNPQYCAVVVLPLLQHAANYHCYKLYTKLTEDVMQILNIIWVMIGLCTDQTFCSVNLSISKWKLLFCPPILWSDFKSHFCQFVLSISVNLLIICW